MKAIHNNNGNRIVKFELSKLGENTFGNASDFYYAITSLLGVWFSDQKLNHFDNAHEYEVNDDNFLVVDDIAELVDICGKKIEEIEGEINESELMEDIEASRKIAIKLRKSFLNDGYTGIYVNDDSEFDCTSLCVIDFKTIS